MGKPQPVARSTDGLRDALFETLEGLRAGTTSVQEANARCGVTKQILATVKADLDAARIMKELGFDETAATLRPSVLTFQGRSEEAAE